MATQQQTEGKSQQAKSTPTGGGKGRGRQPSGDGEDRIHLTDKGKDHKKNGDSQDRFALYKNNMTVNAYIEACAKLPKKYPASKARADIKWDRDHGFIRIEPAPKKASS